MKSDLITVLDLGDSKVTAVAASGDDPSGMQIEALATTPSTGMRRGQVADVVTVAVAVDRVLREIQAETGQPVTSVVVGVSGGHLEGVNSQGFKPITPRTRAINHQDVLEVINHSRALVLPSDREQIQALPREFHVDGAMDRRPVGKSGGKLDVTTFIVTGNSSAVQLIDKAVSQAGRRVDQMVAGALASGIGVLTAEDMELGAIVVDLGAGTTDISIFANGSIIYIACIPIGSQHVTSDISQLLKTTPEEAERLKVTAGKADTRRVNDRDTVEVLQVDQPQPRALQRIVLCEIIESRMREIAKLVLTQIERSGAFESLPVTVVLTGGGTLLGGTDQVFEDVLKPIRARVRIAEPELDPKYGNPVGMAKAIGLARFAIQCQDDITPATGPSAWKERVRGLISLFGGQ